MQRALSTTRTSFPQWYQAVVREAELAEPSPVRGCMVIKPWGYGIWEQIQQQLDHRIKATGHENCYFPLFVPLSFISKEADHVEGFAKEMAVVTHHRLKGVQGKLQPDPDARLEEPLIVRPTSETIVGDAFQRWIKSYRDLPLLINQWANVVRWEMRTRLFLRTTEFLWQEGHTAHADEAEARMETLKMLEVYREFSENVLAMPVITGEKSENERFPGAVNTFSIEAMMQDGKALQAGTSHYLGTHFSEAQNIRYQDMSGELTLCHTTSWGASTRLIGGVIMTHGDDDGLRLPPAIAPRQMVIVPMLRDKHEDDEVLTYCNELASDLGRNCAFGAPVRVLVDKKPFRSAEKRWNWVRRGAPVIIEIGPRDAANGQVTYVRRDQLRNENRLRSSTTPYDVFVEHAPSLLAEIQRGLFDEAQNRLSSNICTDIKTFDELADYFGSDSEGESNAIHGWVRAPWCKPSGRELQTVEGQLKTLGLSLRNVPLDQPDRFGPCLFSSQPGVQEVLIARAY